MLALIAGTGDLPPALLARLAARPIVCALQGFAPQITPDITFRIEQLGSFLADLSARGVTRICMAGAVKRPVIDPAQIDAATLPLVAGLQTAMAKGDDGTLRGVIAIFENAGFAVVAAHDLAPDLLPATGISTKKTTSLEQVADAEAGEMCIHTLGLSDIGQACIVRGGLAVLREDSEGTDAMLRKLASTYQSPKKPDSFSFDPFLLPFEVVVAAANGVTDWLAGEPVPQSKPEGGILFKAPKPDQDRRADLPVIGPRTAMLAAEARLDGIVIEAGGVMVLNLDGVLEILDAQKMFLWVRPKGGA